MLKRIILCVLIIAILVGCMNNTSNVTVFTIEPDNSPLLGYSATRTYKITVYHKDGILKKIIGVEKYVIDKEGINVLSEMAKRIKKSFEDSKIRGFSFKSKIEDNIYTHTIELDYEKMDIRKIIEENPEETNIMRKQLPISKIQIRRMG